MRVQLTLGIAGLVLSVAGCQDVTAPKPDARRAVVVPGVNLQTGPSNQCRAEIVAGIASTWPWAHEGHEDFPPPPGAIALWIEQFGPDVGVSSVRELQEWFCSD